jgi:hypothetical protein
MVMESTERFGNRADAYTRGRPTYPPAIVTHLEKADQLSAGSRSADTQ